MFHGLPIDGATPFSGLKTSQEVVRHSVVKVCERALALYIYIPIKPQRLVHILSFVTDGLCLLTTKEPTGSTYWVALDTLSVGV